MPKLVGKSTVVVEHDGIVINELAGNASTFEDTISIAKVTVANASAEPWLTIEYDEWICVLKGIVEIHHGNDEVLRVNAGETCFIAKGERFQPVFPEGGVEYIPVCSPAFKPERCHREEEENSQVSARLKELHSNKQRTTGQDQSDLIYHMCQKLLWEECAAAEEAYFPPTFDQDGGFTHATAVPDRLIDTANHFYTETVGDWICVELSQSRLHNLGIVTRLEDPKPVGEKGTDNKWNEWRCPHIFGGIPSHYPGVVVRTYPMTRNEEGIFLNIEGLTDCAAQE